MEFQCYRSGGLKMISDDSFDPFLASLGWDHDFQRSFAETDVSEFQVGRIVGQGKGHYHLQVTLQSTQEAAITTKFHDSIREAADFPTVGDWVTYKLGVGNQHASIHRIIKRKSLLQRRRAGSEHDMQMIAANVDEIFIVTSCNEDFDVPRLGRYIALARDSEITPIFVLTKTDLSSNPQEYVSQLKAAFQRIPVLLVSNQHPESIEQLKEFFGSGKTAVLLGSSGVGKSTLTNELLGFNSQKTQTVSSESRGRHTTTARNLRFTRWGGIVIDTPGMQEISEQPREDDLQKNFADLEELALKCKFSNCLHKNEPGCSVKKAVSSGQVTAARMEAYVRALEIESSKMPKYSR